MIREQDLQLAMLRASLGTSAQQDPSLSRLRFQLPSGPLRPLLPSLATSTTTKDNTSSMVSIAAEATTFDDLLLGTPLVLNYKVSWPLDLFLHTSDLQIYATLFSYLSALRKTHTRIHTCWTALSNAQRARRRWTGLGEGGTIEDLEVRKELLRCSWGVVREMSWFLDTLVGYVMTDVVDVEFGKMKERLLSKPAGLSRGVQSSSEIGSISAAGPSSSTVPQSISTVSAISGAASSHLDFSTLRNIHTTSLERLLTGSLLSNPTLTSTLRVILQVCERFVAQVERWGGDVLPALLFEGSLAAGSDKVGEMVAERRQIVAEINQVTRILRAFASCYL